MKELNYEKVFQVLVEETSNYVRSNRLRAMVLGVSGGIDSTIVAAICHEVSKLTNVPLIGRSLPIKNKKDEFDVSKLVGEAFCNDFKVWELSHVYKAALLECCLETGEANASNSYWIDELEEMPSRTPIANGNLQARCRMMYLYDLAGLKHGLVMSTDNRTEYQLGFWTIHGDVGDFDPIQGLWKTEVYELAEWLVDFYFTDGDDASKAVAIRESMKLTPTDGLGISNSDLEQIGAKSYNDVDRLLKTLVCKASQENSRLQDELTEELGRDVVGKVLERHIKSKFKRLLSPIIVPREKYAGLS
jgi:NAD+ synthetase|nr:MAG TPA: hypothetical protein [Caudoviricetes sp.]